MESFCRYEEIQNIKYNCVAQRHWEIESIENQIERDRFKRHVEREGKGNRKPSYRQLNIQKYH